MSDSPFEGLRDINLRYETHCNRLRIVSHKTGALVQASLVILTFLRQFVNEDAEGAVKLLSDMDLVIENLPEDWNDMKDAMDLLVGDILAVLEYSQTSLEDFDKRLDELVDDVEEAKK